MDDLESAPQGAPTTSMDGFTLIEVLIILIVLGILAAVVVFSLRGVTADGNTSACSANARTVGVAVSAYLEEHPGVANVSEAQLTAAGTGTLQSWPTSGNAGYTILIASAANGLAGTTDALGNPIADNDVVVDVGGTYYDSTASLPSACAAAT